LLLRKSGVWRDERLRALTDDSAAQAALDMLNMKQKANVEAVAADMWVPYKNAIESQLPNAVLVHDRFHVMGYLTKALDKVRKKEHWELKAHGNQVLTGTQYLWLTSQENRSLEQKRAYRYFSIAGALNYAHTDDCTALIFEL
jgi:transposase